MSPLLYPVVMRIPSRIQALGPAFPGWLESLLIIVLCWQGAGMFWTLFAPSTQNVNLLMPQQSSDRSLVIRDTFLNWYVSENKAATEAPEVYRLLGIIAGENGSAVLKTTDGVSVAVRLGGEIAPGVRLVALEASQITIERAGVRQIIKLPEKSSATQIANGERPSMPMSTPVHLDALSPMRQQSALNRGMREQSPVRIQEGIQSGGVAITNPAPDSGGNVVGESSSSGSAQTLQQDSKSQTTSSNQATSTPQSTVLNTTTPTASLAPITLQRGQLFDIIPDSSTPGWNKGLAVASEGGIRVNDVASQPLFTLLQLRNGDILKRVGDQKLSSVSDINFVFQAFAQQSSANRVIDLVLVRGGVTYSQRYTIVNTITLSRGQLLAIIQSGNVGGWDKGLSTAPGGGIRVDDATIHPLAKTLQLKSGDVLKSINNSPLTQVSDISLFFQAFGSSDSVNLVLIRNGTTLTQHYDIQP